MTTVALKQIIINTVNELPANRLQAALDYLEYLKEQDATAEIVANKQLMQDARMARRDWQAGKTNQFAAWRNMRRDV